MLLAGLLCCVYLLSYTGAFRVDDEHILAARAQSLALRGRFEEPQVYGNTRALSLSRLGDQATQIEPLQTVLGAALYSLGLAAGVGAAQAMLTLNLYLTGLTGGLVLLTVVALGFGRRVGIWCGMLFGLATIVWPYASTFLRDSLAMAMTSLAFLGWALTLRGERRWRAIGLAAILLGVVGGILSKNTAWAAGMALAIAALVRWTSQGSGTRNGGLFLAAAIVGAASLILVIILLPPAGPLARFSADYYRFLASHFMGSLTPSLLTWVIGPFLSPAKSIFLFSPALLLAVAGSYLGWKEGRHFILPVWLTAVALALGQALFYRDQWAGTYAWGLRAMLPAVPPLIAVGAWTVRDLLQGGAVRRVVLWAVAIAGFGVQLAGSSVTWNRVYAVWASRGLDPFAPASSWRATFLAIGPQVALLFDPSAWSLAWVRVWRTHPTSAGMLMIAGVVLLVLIGWRLRRELGRPGAAASAWAAALFAAAIVFPLWPMLSVYRTDPAFGGDRPGYRAIVQSLQEEVKAGGVVVVDPYASRLWLAMINTWNSPVAWYSLPIELPGIPSEETPGAAPAPEVVDLFGRLLDSSTMWYAAVAEVPSESLESKLRWLEEDGTFVGEIVLEGVSPAIVLRAYRR